MLSGWISGEATLPDLYMAIFSLGPHVCSLCMYGERGLWDSSSSYKDTSRIGFDPHPYGLT